MSDFRRTRQGWFVLGCLLICCSVAAQGDHRRPGWEPAVGGGAQPGTAPRIGLALSGGGARGLAHVGVLRVLEEEGVGIDLIAGTSMGAVVGGLYAAGVPLDEIERLAVELDWREALKDQVGFRQLPFRRKQDQRRYRTALKLGVGKGGLSLPTGLLFGQKLESMLRLLLTPTAGDIDFSRLPIPFRAIAADLETGEQVVLRRGDLTTAIRASLAIPGMFTPVEIDGRLLADGGIANNLPVDVARDMGADLVIAVDISEPLLRREDLQTAFGILAQTISFLTRSNMESRLEAADLVITPDLEGYGVLSFRDARELVEAGYRSAAARRNDLARFVLSPSGKADSTSRRTARLPDPPARNLAFVRIEGCSRVDERVVRSRLSTRAGAPLDVDALAGDLERVFALDHFQKVSFELATEGDQQGLVLLVEEKNWAPNVLRLGLTIESDLEQRSVATAVLDLTTRGVNARDGEWRNDFRLGTDSGLTSELYQPLSFSGGPFVAPSVGWQRRHQGVWNEGSFLEDLEIEELFWRVDLGFSFGASGEVRAGVFGGRRDLSPGSDLLASFPEISGEPVDFGGLRLRLVVDAVDRPSFPSQGLFLRFDFVTQQGSLGADIEYERLELQLGAFAPFGRHSLGLRLIIGSSLGSDLPFHDRFRLGGPSRLSALGTDELRGQLVGSARLSYSYRLTELPSAVGEGVFGGGWLESGNVWQNHSQWGEDLLYSGTVFVGAETLVGPLMLGYSQGDGGRERYFLLLGNTF